MRRGIARHKAVLLVVAAARCATLFLTLPGAHVGGSGSHLWNDHITPRVTDLVYTKQQARRRFQGVVIRSGQTVRGTIGAVVHGPDPNYEGAANASLPAAAPQGLSDDTVTVNGGDDEEGNNRCRGTARAPTAPRGHVCIYPYSRSNAGELEGYIWGVGDGIKWGFQVSWIAGSSGQSEFFATWAYRAP